MNLLLTWLVHYFLAVATPQKKNTSLFDPIQRENAMFNNLTPESLIMFFDFI
jgi:hypothetical protein